MILNYLNIYFSGDFHPLYLIPLMCIAYLFSSSFKISFSLFKSDYVNNMVLCVFNEDIKENESSLTLFKRILKYQLFLTLLDVYIVVTLSSLLIYCAYISIICMFSIEYFDSMYHIFSFFWKIPLKVIFVELTIMLPQIVILMYIVALNVEFEIKYRGKEFKDIVFDTKIVNNMIKQSRSLREGSLMIKHKLLYENIFKSPKRISLYTLLFGYVASIYTIFKSLF